MKANELRLGNILMYNSPISLTSQTVEVNIYHLSDILGHTPLSYSDRKNAYQAIPITEEWLIKFGFEGDDDERHIVLGLGGGEELSIERLTKTCCLIRAIKNESVDFVYVAYPEYVHQLQNLYFSITGKELEVKS